MAAPAAPAKQPPPLSAPDRQQQVCHQADVVAGYVGVGHAPPAAEVGVGLGRQQHRHWLQQAAPLLWGVEDEVNSPPAMHQE